MIWERKWISKEEAMKMWPDKPEIPKGKEELFMVKDTNDDDYIPKGLQPKSDDPINHPSHYQGKKFEVIDIIEDFDLNFTLGNAIKYILRSGKKNGHLEDLKKAMWYLEREVSRRFGGKAQNNE